MIELLHVCKQSYRRHIWTYCPTWHETSPREDPLGFIPSSRRKVFNSTFDVYYNIGLFLYIRLNKISPNRTSFNFNHIHSQRLKKFSCKLYYKVLQDLEKNEIIKTNNHWCYFKNTHHFTKSFLIHRSIYHKIDESKQKLKYELVEIEVPEKVEKILGVRSASSAEDRIFRSRKLNRCNRTNHRGENIDVLNFYSSLKYSEKKLEEYCRNDEILYTWLKRRLEHLKDKPRFIKGRWYHPFHELPKKIRENVLMFENQQLKEIFDISGSDLHMIAKQLEYENVPLSETMKFQKLVKEDFRTLFGKKKNGKCTAYVKKAFKTWLNMKKEKYDELREGSIVWRIDNWFKRKLPNIRRYVVETDDAWRVMMDREFDVMSVKLMNDLNKMGIKALTCHDAIYVKKSVDIPNIKEMFYQRLDFISDRTEKMMEL